MYISSCVTLNETIMAKNIGVLGVFFPEHPKRDQKSEIYTPKRDDEHPRHFHMRVPPPGVAKLKTRLADGIFI